MKRCLLQFVFICFNFLNSAWALPWFSEQNLIEKPPTIKENAPNNPVNFSGLWVGECNQQPAVNMTIRQENDKLWVSYGFMEEKYILGEVTSTTTTRINTSTHGNNFVTLDPENKALIFLNADLFKNQNNFLNVFFSKVVMVLDNDYLSVRGLYYHSSTNMDDVQQHIISCVYRRNG